MHIDCTSAIRDFASAPGIAIGGARLLRSTAAFLSLLSSETAATLTAGQLENVQEKKTYGLKDKTIGDIVGD